VQAQLEEIRLDDLGADREPVPGEFHHLLVQVSRDHPPARHSIQQSCRDPACPAAGVQNGLVAP
jgi:hypothetical protein